MCRYITLAWILIYFGSCASRLTYNVITNLTEHRQSFLFTQELSTNCHKECRAKRTQNILCIGYGYNTTLLLKHQKSCILLLHATTYNSLNVELYNNGKDSLMYNPCIVASIKNSIARYKPWLVSFLRPLSNWASSCLER